MRAICRKKSKFQNIEIFQSKDNGKLLVIDKFLMLSERFEFAYHEMMVHVPLFSHIRPEDILIVGGGDGGCVRECLKHQLVKTIDLCEIDKKVIDLSKKYLPFVGSYLRNTKLKIHYQDGFHYLTSLHNKKYDVILVDSTDPDGPAAILFTRKFYQAAIEHLKNGGILGTIGTTPFFEKNLLKKIDRALNSSFRYVKHYLAFVPMYQSGCWSFMLASNKNIPTRAIRDNVIHPSSLDYYNAEIHKSSFALPSFYKRMVISSSPNKL